MRIAVTRPAEDAGPLKARLEALGHDVIVVPLLMILPRQDVPIPDRPWQAIVCTSANGIRSLSGHDHLKSVRMLTVGPQSLAAARRAGFARTEAHGGNVDGLAAFIRGSLDPAAGPILYLSGSETAGDLEAQLKVAHFDCERSILYDAVPAASFGPIASALRERNVDAVLLYSPRSARIWRSLVEAEDLGEAAAVPHYLCLSPNVAAQLPPAWRLHVAATADDTAMMALLEQTAGTR
jgi:uroporphyrinogen-III synthase